MSLLLRRRLLLGKKEPQLFYRLVDTTGDGKYDLLQLDTLNDGSGSGTASDPYWSNCSFLLKSKYETVRNKFKNVPWNGQRGNVTRVEILDSVGDKITPLILGQYYDSNDSYNQSTRWFRNMSKLVTIDGTENLDTSKLTRLDKVFQGCRKLETLDLSSWDVSNVTTMQAMFGTEGNNRGCDALVNIDVST